MANATLNFHFDFPHPSLIILYHPQYPLKCPLSREQRHAYGYTSWSMETAEDNFNPSYRFFLSIESITFHLTFWLELIKILPLIPRPSTFDSNPSFMGAFGVFFTAVTGELITMDWCSMIRAAIIVLDLGSFFFLNCDRYCCWGKPFWWFEGSLLLHPQGDLKQTFSKMYTFLFPRAHCLPLLARMWPICTLVFRCVGIFYNSN